MNLNSLEIDALLFERFLFRNVALLACLSSTFASQTCTIFVNVLVLETVHFDYAFWIVSILLLFIWILTNKVQVSELWQYFLIVRWLVSNCVCLDCLRRRHAFLFPSFNPLCITCVYGWSLCRMLPICALMWCLNRKEVVLLNNLPIIVWLPNSIVLFDKAVQSQEVSKLRNKVFTIFLNTVAYLLTLSFLQFVVYNLSDLLHRQRLANFHKICKDLHWILGEGQLYSQALWFTCSAL